MWGPWLGMGFVVGTLAVLVVVLRATQKLLDPPPELVRKALHVSMGIVAVCFPWLFDESWPVLVLGTLSLAGMLAMRTVSALRCSVGNIISAVGRASFGEVYFPLSIAILWHLYIYLPEGWPFATRAVLYCVPLLLLALADAAAALVGSHYGQNRYVTPDGMKSAEGSVAFFLCASACVHVPILLATDTGRLESLLIAVLLAYVATLFEAIAWGGLDNLALPVVSHLLLRVYLDLSTEDLMMRLGVTAALMVFVFWYRSRTTLESGALLGAVLVGYLCWALGGWRWVLAPTILFLTYPLLSPRKPANSLRTHNVHAVICVSSASLGWLFLYRLMGWPELLYPFTLAFAAHLAIIGIVRLGGDYPNLPAWSLLVRCVLMGWAILFLPYLALERSWAGLLGTAAALPAVAIAAVGFYLLQPNARNCPLDTPRYLRQAAAGALGSAAGLLVLYAL